MRPSLAALALLLLVALAAPAPAQQQPFVVGFNQAWIEGKWARDLTSGFDEADWRRVLSRTRESGGSVLRVWLFEDRVQEGVRWDHHRPVGVDPALLANVRRLAALAAEEGVRIYWTAHDGNWFWEERGIEWDRQYNVLNDRFGYGRAFREQVLGPVLDAIAARPEAVYGFDIMNEVTGSVRKWLWSDGWTGARRYVRETAAFIHGRVPWLKVTASSGHHSAATDILDGRYDGLGLDFLDLHVYTDDLRVPRGAALVAHARRQGVPIVLGEFGQARKGVDDGLQARQVTGMLEDARRLGFAAALTWRLEDAQADGRRFSFFDGDTPRPAVAAMRAFAERHGLVVCRPPAPSTTPGMTGALGE